MNQHRKHKQRHSFHWTPVRQSISDITYYWKHHTLLAPNPIPSFLLLPIFLFTFYNFYGLGEPVSANCVKYLPSWHPWFRKYFTYTWRIIWLVGFGYLYLGFFDLMCTKMDGAPWMVGHYIQGICSFCPHTPSILNWLCVIRCSREWAGLVGSDLPSLKLDQN